MAEFRNPTYKFKFANPILFRRVYDFKIYSSFANEHWSPLDSNKKEITKYQTKDTLVYDMSLTYRQQKSKINSYYYVTLRGANTRDAFKVSVYSISNLLEIFGIM